MFQFIRKWRYHCKIYSKYAENTEVHQLLDEIRRICENRNSDRKAVLLRKCNIQLNKKLESTAEFQCLLGIDTYNKMQQLLKKSENEAFEKIDVEKQLSKIFNAQFGVSTQI